MKVFKAVFKIVENNRCPLYEDDELFVLTDKSLSFSANKESCLILVREMTELLFKLLDQNDQEDWEATVYDCSGCTGLIKFVRVSEDAVSDERENSAPLLSEKEQKLFDKISSYPLLKSIPPNQLKQFIGYFKAERVTEGELLIKKGEINRYIYIILSGGVIIEDGVVTITTLGESEICGEMSYFGNSVAGSSVRALPGTAVLRIRGLDFSQMIKQADSIQFYMAKLLAERLSKSNASRGREFDACLRGSIEDLAPAELLQVFNMHQKTGTLSLELPRGVARILFCEGGIISATYWRYHDEEAVYAIMAETEGSYKFIAGLSHEKMKTQVIGDFMTILMEGVRRVDEVEQG
jgi:CRP/FNR family transcriptional regulator, cyclic AMP receptor protein